ncbi:MAG TPA: hypothetical protein ENI11_00155 [Actinobacteria bacterium]|nr:hypothetical protein [Actinomycetota bacterium]
MLIQLIKFLFILAGAVGGYQLTIETGWPGTDLNKNTVIIISMITGSGLGYIFGGLIGTRLSRLISRIEDRMLSIPITALILGTAGLATGLSLAYLMTAPFALIEASLPRKIMTVFVYIFLVWLSVHIVLSRRAELKNLFNLNEPSMKLDQDEQQSIGDKLLDTNIIIDGRIIDLAHTGFLEGRLLVPRFVLHELQTIADSADSLKRNRGRRGLDILNSLQVDFNLQISITEIDYPDIVGVDAKLVCLAKETGASIITNDYNLGKVAQLEGIKILNLNDLAGAVKVVVLPGEEMVTKIIREGKELGQGIGYMEDGTMVVVDGGVDYVGKSVNLQVTSVLQTPAGRMIFTKIKTPARI